MKGPKKTGILLYPRHAWTNYQMYEAQDKPMPVAIMIGHHPMYYFAAATTTQYGVDEFEIACGFAAGRCRVGQMPHRRSRSAGLGRDRSRRRNSAQNARAGRAVQRVSGLLSNRFGAKSHRQHQSDHHAQRRDLQKRPERHRSRRLRLPQSSHVGADPAARAQRRRPGRCAKCFGHAGNLRRGGADEAALLRRGEKRA